jgi:hypothetical protein
MILADLFQNKSKCHIISGTTTVHPPTFRPTNVSPERLNILYSIVQSCIKIKLKICRKTVSRTKRSRME